MAAEDARVELHEGKWEWGVEGTPRGSGRCQSVADGCFVPCSMIRWLGSVILTSVEVNVAVQPWLHSGAIGVSD